MSGIPRTLNQFKEEIYNNLIKNVGVKKLNNRAHLKVQLIESNLADIPPLTPDTEWRTLDDTSHWYVSSTKKGYIILNKFTDRIWAAYSLMDVDLFSKNIKKWIDNTLGLDQCWLPRGYLQGIGKEMKWNERGVGIKYKDILSTEEYPSQISLKAWYGPNDEINRLLDGLKNNFSINSIRFKDNSSTTVSEWYSNGKITFNSAEDVDDLINSTFWMMDKYNSELNEIDRLRQKHKSSFEVKFKQTIDLEKYYGAISSGMSDLKLWMIETENLPDFRRFRGIDLHTWDRVFLDVGNDYAYLTIPNKGCVNAAPRLATVQGQTLMGKTQIYYDGVEVFV